MKKMILSLLAVSAFTASAHASYILECKTLGGKDLKIQYVYLNGEYVLEDVSVGAEKHVEATAFSFTRSGIRITLANGVSVTENNGQIQQTAGTGELKDITCKRSDTLAKKEIPKDF